MLRIAVCLSGQPRSIEHASKSLLDCFSGQDGNTYDFFCHSWDYNTWKLQTLQHSPVELVNRDWLQDQLNKFNPKKTLIESEVDLQRACNGKYVKYGSLLYSTMQSIHMKRLYEVEHDFTYDYVVKARYDNIFSPSYTIPFPRVVSYKTIYVPHFGRLGLEYNRKNASDCLYYGDSWSMDIAGDLFRVVYKMQAQTDVLYDDDDSWGPGTLMTTYGHQYNIEFTATSHYFPEIMHRKEAIGLDPVLDFDEIVAIHTSFYTGNKFA